MGVATGERRCRCGEPLRSSTTGRCFDCQYTPDRMPPPAAFCAGCRDEVSRFNPAFPFCSPACLREHKPAAREGRCEQCRGPFHQMQAGGPGKRFCSRLCQDRWHRAERPPAEKRRFACKGCGEPLASYHTRAAFCGKACYMRGRRAAAAVPVTQKPCAHCAAPFTGKTKRAVYCGKPCALKSYRAREAAHAAA